VDDVLRGAVAWSEAVQPLGDHGPWLLVAGGRTPRKPPPSSLDGLLGELGRRFDRVLVAAPDLQRAASLRAARAAPSTLVLVERRRTRGPALARGLDELEAVGARPAGLVLLG
jgi:hypothetical protein